MKIHSSTQQDTFKKAVGNIAVREMQPSVCHPSSRGRARRAGGHRADSGSCGGVRERRFGDDSSDGVSDGGDASSAETTTQ